MNIFKRELRANLKSLIIWCVSMFFLIYAGMIKYTGYAKAGQNVNELFNQLPSAFKAILGLNTLNATSISGFYSIFYLYFMLLAGIHAIMLGSVIMSKEERDKTADFLFAKPLLRSKIVTAKFLAIFINLIILNLTTLFSSILFVTIFNNGQSITDIIIMLMIPLFILQIIFATLGTFIAVITKNTKRATSLSTAILLSTFILSVAIDLYNKIDYLKYLTPFKYFPASNVIISKSYETSFIILSFIISIGFIITTYILTDRRELCS